MVICCSVRSTVVPLSDPAVTTSNFGTPRPPRGVLAGRGGGACRGGRACRARPRRGSVPLPSRSVRTTPMAAMTNSHRTARKATLIRVRVSSFIPCDVLALWALVAAACVRSILAVPALLPEHQGRTAKRDLGAVSEHDPPDRLAVHERAVGRAAVHEDHLIIFYPKLRMMPGYAGIDKPQVTVGAAPEQRHRRHQIIRSL